MGTEKEDRDRNVLFVKECDAIKTTEEAAGMREEAMEKNTLGIVRT